MRVRFTTSKFSVIFVLSNVNTIKVKRFSTKRRNIRNIFNIFIIGIIININKNTSLGTNTVNMPKRVNKAENARIIKPAIS